MPPTPSILSRLLVVLAALFVLLGPAAPARAERVNTPLSVLKQAPYQLDVTVLSIETKEGPHSGQSLWFRVRVDRVLVGSGLKAGDETAVVSVRYNLPPGAVGTTGDRGLPSKGDRVRLYAEGKAQVLTSVPPNGWQPIEPTIAILAADDAAGAETSMPFLAELVAEAKLGRASVHLAATGNGTGSPGAPKADEKGYFTNDAQLRYAGDTVVLGVRGLRPDYNTALSVDDALLGGRPLVAFRNSIDTYAKPADGKDEKHTRFGVDTFGTHFTGQGAAGTRTRVLPPADASHPVIAGLKIPMTGLDLPGILLEVAPLPVDCRVLLWGEPLGADGKPSGAKQPVLWVREVSRKVVIRKDVETKLPPQRVVVTTLGDAADFSNPEFRVLAVQMIAWAGDGAVPLGEAERQRARAHAMPPRP